MIKLHNLQALGSRTANGLMQRKETVYILSALSGGIQITEHGQVKFKDGLYPSLKMPALNNSDAWPCRVPNNKTSP